VHSSTLVTAGVYLIICFNNFSIETDVRVVLSFIPILTMFMTNFENNFKKIIALSTLRQLGLIMIILRFGFRIIAYYLLLVHAIFKSMLFMAAGAVIHLIKNTQDIRLLGNLNEVIPYVIIRLISRMALRGVPFMAGFYRKFNYRNYLWKKGIKYIYVCVSNYVIIVNCILFITIFLLFIF